MKIMIFPTTQVAAFENGEQVPELQESLIMLFAQHAESLGYDPTTFEIDVQGIGKLVLFKTEHGFNWDIKR